jgi:hypothetical protein
MAFTRNRRRTPRLFAGWSARYTAIEGDDRWFECTVADVSLGGIGLELAGPTPAPEAVVWVELRTNADGWSGLRLRGRIRNLMSDASDAPSATGTRVGIEWVALTDLEREFLTLLLEQQPAGVR